MSLIDLFIILGILPSGFFALGGAIGAALKKKVKIEIRPFSMIVPFRNETTSLQKFLASIEKSMNENGELLLINDHSENESLEQIKKWFEGKNKNWKLIHLSDLQCGKREALKQGIKEAKHPIIISSDADCEWNKRAMECISSNKEKKLTMLTVVYKNKNGFFRGYLESELLILNSYGSAYARISLAFLASGAAMCFEKSDFIDYLNSSESKKYKSGDDMYFLEFLIKKYGRSSVEHRVSAEAYVKTEMPENISSYLKQRSRWGGKAPKLKNSIAYFAAIATSLYSFAFLAVFVLLPFHSFNVVVFALLTMKVLAEITIGILTSRRLNYPVKIPFLPLVPILSPFFFIVILVRILTIRDQWKGR